MLVTKDRTIDLTLQKICHNNKRQISYLCVILCLDITYPMYYFNMFIHV